MTVKLLDTLTGKKKPLAKQHKLRLFVCGPTVYNFSHIGHARTYLAFDILVRYLRRLGYQVFYLQNITDVDDKIIDRANKLKKDPRVLARDFEKKYREDTRTLGITTVNKYARATDHIKEIQNQIKRLFKKGFAYQTKNGIYFEVKKIKGYGRLSKQNLEALRPGWRIEPDPEKKDPLDFALWKFARNSSQFTVHGSQNKNLELRTMNYEPLWRSPWGWGRPGWHIEDTAITEKFFGLQYELHGGATELKFPHHEAEIAQARALSSKSIFVKIWLHTGVLFINKEKMSKSLGNFITIRDFLKKYPAEVLRFIILSHHYRSPIDYNDNLAQQARQTLAGIKEFLAKLRMIKGSRFEIRGSGFPLKITGYQNAFEKALADDFNTPKALAVIFELIKIIQPKVWQLNKKGAAEIYEFIKKQFEFFGLKLKMPKIPDKIRRLALEREGLRLNKQFIQSDALRKKINALGYIIEDTPRGPFAWFNRTNDPNS